MQVSWERICRAAALTAALVFLPLAACGGDDGDNAAPRGATTTVAPDGNGAVAITATVDWRDRTVELEGADPRWHVAFCEGEAPVICVSEEGQHAGTVELADFPVNSIPTLRRGLRVWAEESTAGFKASREADCGDDYHIGLDPIEALTVAGQPGVRYAFTGSRAGAVVERTISYATTVGDTFFIINADGYDEGACLPRESDFTATDLAAFAPVLHALATGSRLPAPGSSE